MAGVLGACAMGGALGFWARPGEAGDAPRPARPATPEKALEIVVADAPLSPGQPLDVLPAGTSRASLRDGVPPPARPAIAPPLQVAPAPAEPMDTMAPRRPASGLMRVDAPVIAAPPPLLKVLPPPKPAPDLKAEAARAERRREAEQAKVAEQQRLAAAAEKKAEARRVASEKAEAKAEAARKAEARLAEQRRAEAHKAELRAEAAEGARQARVAKAEAAKAAKLAKAQKAKAEAQARAAEKAEAIRQAKLDAAREKAREDAKAARIAALVKALKAAPRRIAAEAHQAQRRIELADAEPVRAARPAPRAAAPRADSPMRLAKATCTSSDPGEALVCADSRLGARDRQLQEAYRSAEAAGVPPDALRRQQARWLQARAAAAREDRWAVEDVYEARISELKELTRDHEN